MHRRNLIASAVAAIALPAVSATAQTEISWWHAMTGANAEVVEKIAADFNASQSDYKLVPTFKGTYPETLNAGIAAFRAGQAPDIMQVFDVGTGVMMAAEGAVKPVAEVLEHEVRDLPRLHSDRGLKLDLDQLTITCPSGNTEPIRLGTVAHFPAETCAACPNRARCTTSAESRGRSVSIAADEPLQKELREAIATPKGRARLRRRVMIEHRLAHHARKQGHRARYIGRRKNVFDARRHAATINLERLQLAEAA